MHRTYRIGNTLSKMEALVPSLLLLALYLTDTSDGQAITNPPESASVAVGINTTFTCGVDMTLSSAIFWERNVDKDSPTEIIYINQGGTTTGLLNNPDKFLITGTYDLTVLNVQMGDAGRYTCRLLPNGDAFIVNLIVIERPLARSPVETAAGSHAELACEVHFGAPRHDILNEQQFPVLRAFLQGHFLEDPITDVLEEGIPGVVPYTIRLEYNITLLPDHKDQDLTCEVRTDDPYFALSATETMRINYPPDMLIIEPILSSYTIGDIITCSAEGSPQPDMGWVAELSTGPRPVTGLSYVHLEITENMVGHNVWKCSAQNIVDGDLHVISQDITFTVETKPVEKRTEPAPKTNTAAIALGIVVPLVVIIIVIILVILILKRRKSTYKPGKEAKAREKKEAEQNGNRPYEEVATEEPDVENGDSPRPVPAPRATTTNTGAESNDVHDTEV